MVQLRKHNMVTFKTFVLAQFAVATAFLMAWYLLPDFQRMQVAADILQRPVPVDVIIADTQPVRIAPLYNDESVVTDEELAAVLKKILPRFNHQHLRPNYVEHALRTWGGQIEFENPALISGPDMAGFLLDSSRYTQSWGDAGQPILEPVSDGVSVRWGSDRSTSVHHDHMLASLTEAGIPLDTPVYLPSRTVQFRDILNQAIRDFHVDERETEWSVMAFGFWLAPEGIRTWHNGDGREISFDLLASRLMRNHKQHGVCLGTHRVYSLMALLRLNESYGQDLLSEDSAQAVADYLKSTRDLVIASQSEDGSWPPNWTDGVLASEKVDRDEKWYRWVIATGHHLEWLAIAPEQFHPDRDQVRRGADWLIQNVMQSPQSVIDENYTFYSHVGNALALWRQTRPAEFWVEWRKSHPDAELFEEASEDESPTPATDVTATDVTATDAAH